MYKSQSFIEPYLKANRKAEEAINAGVGREIAGEANGVTAGLPNRSANPIVRSRDIRERAIDRGRPFSKSATVLKLCRLLPRTPIHMSFTQSIALSGSGFFYCRLKNWLWVRLVEQYQGVTRSVRRMMFPPLIALTVMRRS